MSIATKKSRRHERGSAVTEMAILLFPYCLMAIGVIIMGELALGRLETQQAVILTGGIPGEQSEDMVKGYAFQGMKTARWSNVWFEETENPDLIQSYAQEEPVLPYDSSEDIHAGFVRIENPRAVARPQFNSDGTIQMDSDGNPVVETTVVSTAEGQYLKNFKIMTDTDTGEVGREADIAYILGEWLNYSRSQGGFTYTYGGTPHPMEHNSLAGDDTHSPRGEYVLKNPYSRQSAIDEEEAGLGALEDDGDGITYYGVSRNPAVDKGSHYDIAGEVSFDDTDYFDPVVDANGVSWLVNPDSMPAPVLDSYSGGTSGALYDIMTGLPDSD